MKSARVQVPATTANIGAGFDCLGIALRLYNVVVATRRRPPVQDEMAAGAAELFFNAAKIKPFHFSWSVSGDVPRSRGLGSSVTVRLGILHALNELSGRPLDRRRLFTLCADLEGHPDNAAPAAFGGFTVVAPSGLVQRFRVADTLSFVLLIPDFEIATPDARRVLPATIPLQDAARTLGNAAAITAGFTSGHVKNLAGCFGDWLHQPYREPLIPCLPAVLAAAAGAGAIGGWLSGSGSTIAALTTKRPEKVATAMVEASGLTNTRVRVVAADNRGVRVLP